MKKGTISKRILLDDCERRIVMGSGVSISYDEFDRMRLALMGIKHPNLAVDHLRNRWTQRFAAREDEIHQLYDLRKFLGKLSGRRKENG